MRYNDYITVKGIPAEAYSYIVNGKSAIAWVMERQRVKTDKASEIVNDADRYALDTIQDSSFPLKLLTKVVRISVETVSIVRSLPEPAWLMDLDPTSPDELCKCISDAV